MTTTKPPLLTREQAAAYLGFGKVASLDNLLYVGRGPTRVKLGKHCRFKQEDLDAWIEANRQMPASGGAS